MRVSLSQPGFDRASVTECVLLVHRPVDNRPVSPVLRYCDGSVRRRPLAATALVRSAPVCNRSHAASRWTGR